MSAVKGNRCCREQTRKLDFALLTARVAQSSNVDALKAGEVATARRRDTTLTPSFCCYLNDWTAAGS